MRKDNFETLITNEEVLTLTKSQIKLLNLGSCPYCATPDIETGAVPFGKRCHNCDLFVSDKLRRFLQANNNQLFHELRRMGKSGEIDPVHLERLKRHACPYCGAAHVKVGSNCWGCGDIVDPEQFSSFSNSKAA